MDSHLPAATMNNWSPSIRIQSRLTNGKLRRTIKLKRKYQETNPQIGDVNLLQMQNPKYKRRKQETDPLKIDTILEKVFSFLDVNSIKFARQVKKQWSVEGAKILITKCFVKIPLAIKRNTTEMSEFAAFLSHKSKEVSMIPNITVRSFRDLKLWKYLGVLGNQVKSLNLAVVGDDEDWLSELFNLLLNLKYLNIEKEKSQFGYVDAFDYDERHLIIKVLTSVMSKAEKNQDPLVIESLVLLVESMENLKDLEKFSDCSNIRIKDLTFSMMPKVSQQIPQFGNRMGNIINKLLFTNQAVLKSLSLDCTQVFLHLLDIPCLPLLVEFDLQVWPSVPTFFPPSFRFSEKMPNLEQFKILCDGIGYEADFFTNLFENTGTAPTVKRVKYMNCFSAIDIGPLFNLFPNIEDLYISNIRKSSRYMFNSIWENGGNLKNLHLGFSLSNYTGKENLDSIFTGFSRKTVKWVRNTPRETSYKFNNVDILRVNPSILNLKELEKLKIDFVGNGQATIPKGFLVIAAEYAFNLMPKPIEIPIYVLDWDEGLESARKGFNRVAQFSNVSISFGDSDNDSDSD